jgi:hypothetical protein
MSDPERMQLISQMGMSIAKIDTAIRERDVPSASAAYIAFMGAAGVLAMEIDELDHANAN